MFLKGGMYYRVTYAEKNFLYPNIEGLVYIGENLSDEDKEDSWYFQFANSFAKYGSVLETEAGDRAVSIVTAEDVDDILDHNQLVIELEAAALRNKEKIKEGQHPFEILKEK